MNNANTPSDGDNARTQKAAIRPGPSTGFIRLLNLQKREFDTGEMVFELTVDERHLRSFDLVHGGVAMTLLDCSMGTAAGRAAPEGQMVVTVQLNTNFIRTARPGETLIASSELLHLGRRTVVCRGDIKTSDGSLMATGTATFLFVPHPKKAEAT